MKRFHCDTANWHVFARGTRRLELFRDDQDFEQFLIFLSYALEKSGSVLWAYTLMTNHYHLVLRGSSSQLSSCMHRLNRMYSKYHNKRYGLHGHTFDGPYQAFRQATLLLTLRCVAYAFMNPVKGGLCVRPEDYPWSCYLAYFGKAGRPPKVAVQSLIGFLDPDPKKAWARFHEAIAIEGRRPSGSSGGKLTMLEVHIQQFDCLLEYAQAHADQLSGEDPTRVAIYWARQCGVSPRAMAKALKQTSSNQVREVLRRFKQRLCKEPSLKDLLTPP